MDDTDDCRSRSGRNSMFESSRSAFRSQHSFMDGGASVGDDHESLVKAAMEEAEKHPDRHRMAVIPSKSKKKLALVDVHKLTTSKKRLVLSRAMETSGQDNMRLLTKIRERQDRYCTESRNKHMYILTMASICIHTRAIYSAVLLLDLHIFVGVSCVKLRFATTIGRLSASLSPYTATQRLPSRVGVERSKVQIQFRDISYEAEVIIGTSGLPSVSNSFKSLLQVGRKPAMLSLMLNSTCNMLACMQDLPDASLNHNVCCRVLESLWANGLRNAG